MANDADWVEDVKRWYLSGTSNASGVTADAGDDPVAIGYEAAHPGEALARRAQREPGQELVLTARAVGSCPPQPRGATRDR